MDQLKKLAVWLKKYHFWVLSVVVVLVGFVCWYTSAKALATQYKQHEAEIKSKFDIATGISGKPFVPNPEIIDKQRAEIQKRFAAVIATWQQLYDQQHDKVLKWPDALGKDFCDQVDKLKFGDDIPKNLRDVYRNYVEAYFRNCQKNPRRV